MKVDVGEVIKDKKPSLYRKLPRFVIRWFEKIVRQDDINDVLARYGDLTGVDFITHVLDYLRIRRSSEGLEKLDRNGRYIFASNHPLGGVDGFSLAESIEGYFSEVKLVVNDILMVLTPVNSLFIPINKHGRQNTEYVRRLNEELSGNVPIVYFPAGLCSRKINGEITDPKWLKTFVDKAINSGRDIVPTYVDDRNSRFFYGFANARKKLGIKFNIEMALLPGELFKKRGKGNIRIIYGAPIKHEELVNGEKSVAEWVEYIREKTYALGGK